MSCRFSLGNLLGLFLCCCILILLNIPYSAEVLSSLVALQLRGEGLGFAL